MYKNPPDAVRYLEQWEEFYIEGVRRPNHNVRSMYSFKVDDYCIDDEYSPPSKDDFCDCHPAEGWMEFGDTPESDEKYADAWLKWEWD